MSHPPGLCKACRSPRLTPLYRIERTPVFLNKLYETREAAQACPAAKVVLAGCERCGFVFNAAFEDARMDYDALYVQSQGHSPAFDRYSRALADDFAASLRPGAKVVEIGCGKEAYFLKMITERGVDARGFDPLYDGADPRVTRAYFDGESAAGVEADVVVMRLFLYLIEYPLDFLASLKAFLPAETEVFIETPRFEQTLASGAFWDVSHEICDYFTEAFFQTAFAGRARVRTAFSAQAMLVTGRLGDLVDAFPDADAALPPAPVFARALAACDEGLSRHRRNIVWGAGSKGGAFCVALDPEARRIEAIVDINPEKQGRFAAMTGHPCRAPSDVAWSALGDDACLWIMNQNYKSEILASIPDYRGRVIVLDEIGQAALA